MNFIYAFLILLMVITIHEFGHFISARMVGVKVHEFSIGIGPKILSRQGNETLYSIRALPLGGFCKFDDEESDISYNSTINRKDEFSEANNFKKTVILISGVLMNFLTAFFIMLLIFKFQGYSSNLVQNIIPDSVAEKAGILNGDRIIKINDIKIRTSADLMNSKEYINKEYDLSILRNDKVLVKHIKTSDGTIGIYFEKEKELVMSIKLAFDSIGFFISEIFKAIGRLFGGKSKDLMGVVGFVATVGTMQSMNLNMILLIIVNISISLAVFNLIPIPPLDGGHIFIILIESILGRELGEKTKNFIFMIGVIFILYIFIRSLMNDFSRF